MRIAILSFGSLVKNSKGLGLKTKWKQGGPLLSIEFSRISKNGRLTLVINENKGCLNKSWYAISKHNELEKVIKELQKREKIEDKLIHTIGFVNLENGTVNEHSLKLRPNSCNRIAEWATANKIDAVIWSDLNTRFKDAIKIPFSPEAALNYVNTLPPKIKKLAINYIKDVPIQIKTNFRTLFDDSILQ